MYARMLCVVGLVGGLTACSAASRAPAGSAAPVLDGAVAASSTVDVPWSTPPAPATSTADVATSRAFDDPNRHLANTTAGIAVMLPPGWAGETHVQSQDLTAHQFTGPGGFAGVASAELDLVAYPRTQGWEFTVVGVVRSAEPLPLGVDDGGQALAAQVAAHSGHAVTSTRTTVHGRDAVAVEYTYDDAVARTDTPPVYTILQYFVADGPTTYVITCWTPTARYADYADAFHAVAHSFEGAFAPHPSRTPAPVEPLEPPIILTPEYDPTRIAALPPPTRVAGVLAVDTSMGEPIQVPAEVPVGEPFTVTVLTYIPGCNHWGGDPIADTEVVMAGNVATITAYDYVANNPNPDGACTAIGPGAASHTATIQFMEAGEGIVRYADTGVERRVRVR